MRIVDPAKRYSDGKYYVDYGAIALAWHGASLWNHVLRNYTVQMHEDPVGLFGLLKVPRVEVAVDFDAARNYATQRFWHDVVPRVYPWVDRGATKGVDVLAYALDVAQSADRMRAKFHERSQATLKTSLETIDSVAKGFERDVKVLETTAKLSKATLSVLSVFNPILGAGLKGAIKGTELKSAGVSVGNTAVNVGIDLAVDIGKELGGVRKGFAIVAKSANASVAAYMSGKDLPETAIAGLAELVSELVGKATSSDAVKKWISSSARTWWIPLVGTGKPSPQSLDGLLEQVVDVSGKVVKETTKYAITEAGKKRTPAASQSGTCAIPTSAIAISGMGHYQQLIRDNLYRLEQ